MVGPGRCLDHSDGCPVMAESARVKAGGESKSSESSESTGPLGHAAMPGAASVPAVQTQASVHSLGPDEGSSESLRDRASRRRYAVRVRSCATRPSERQAQGTPSRSGQDCVGSLRALRRPGRILRYRHERPVVLVAQLPGPGALSAVLGSISDGD